MKKLLTLVLLLIAVQYSFAQTIQVTTANAYCAGYNIQLSYSASGTFYNGNVFTAHLSDSSGSFANPVTIGTVTSNNSGIIVTTIPANTKSGYHYLIRVISSNPVVNSNPNVQTDNIHITGNETTVTNDTSICAGMSVTLKATGGTSYSWYPSAGLSCNTCSTVEASPDTITTYVVVVSPNNSCGPEADTVVINVINQATGGLITAYQDTVCPGGTTTVFLQGNSTNKIQWQSSLDGIHFTNISGATNNNYTTKPIYQNTFYMTNNGFGNCSAFSDSLEILVLTKSVASYTDSVKGLQVSFDASSSQNAKYQIWNFGDGIADSLVTISHIYSTPGNYHVCLVITNWLGCEGDTLCKDITVGTPGKCEAFFSLVPDSTPHHWFALNQSVGKAPITYNWSWGDGTTGIGDTASHTYAAAGFYNICLTINDDTMCTSTFCDSSTYIFRQESANTMVKVNVVNSLPDGVPIIMPNQNQLTINSNPCTYCLVKGSSNSNDLEVTDLLGRKVNAGFTNAGGGLSFSLPSQPTGIYFIRDNRTGQVIKFVKE